MALLPNDFFVSLDRVMSRGAVVPDWFLKTVHGQGSNAVDEAILSSLSVFFSAKEGDALVVTYLHDDSRRAPSYEGDRRQVSYREIAVFVTKAASLKSLRAPSLHFRPFSILRPTGDGGRGWFNWSPEGAIGHIDLAIPEVSGERVLPQKWGWNDRQPAFVVTLYDGPNDFYAYESPVLVLDSSVDPSGGAGLEEEWKRDMLDLGPNAPQESARARRTMRRMMNPRSY